MWIRNKSAAQGEHGFVIADRAEWIGGRARLRIFLPLPVLREREGVRVLRLGRSLALPCQMPGQPGVDDRVHAGRELLVARWVAAEDLAPADHVDQRFV